MPDQDKSLSELRRKLEQSKNHVAALTRKIMDLEAENSSLRARLNMARTSGLMGGGTATVTK
jgi:phage shock protein A